MATIALMQPYFFPYLGYFELLAQSDTFVFYDDAAFSKNGWYNRNRVLARDKEWEYIRVSVEKAPLGTACCDIALHDKERDLRRILDLLRLYSHAPYYNDVMSLVRRVFYDSSDKLSDVAVKSVLYSSSYIGLETRLLWSSGIDYDRSQPKLAKVLQICERLGATTYLNAPGGRELYSEEEFTAVGMKLRFCPGGPFAYGQPDVIRVINLSVIDAMMWCDPATIRMMVRGRGG